MVIILHVYFPHINLLFSILWNCYLLLYYVLINPLIITHSVSIYYIYQFVDRKNEVQSCCDFLKAMQLFNVRVRFQTCVICSMSTIDQLFSSVSGFQINRVPFYGTHLYIKHWVSLIFKCCKNYQYSMKNISIQMYK